VRRGVEETRCRFAGGATLETFAGGGDADGVIKDGFSATFWEDEDSMMVADNALETDGRVQSAIQVTCHYEIQRQSLPRS